MHNVSVLSLRALFFCLPLILAACQPYLLRPGRAGQIRVGKDFMRLQSAGWQKQPGRDTLFNEGGYRWRGLVWELDSGLVLVEEDFMGLGRINRIRVETPLFQTRGGIRVGQPVGQMMTQPGPWTCVELHGYNRLDFSSPAFPGLHFLVPWSGETPEPGSTPCDIDLNLPIVSIVLM